MKTWPGTLVCARMRAVRISEWGGPEVLELIDDAAVPEPGPGEVRIEVSLAGVNFADTHARENRYVVKYDLPFTPGSEVAGTIDGSDRRVVALLSSGGYAQYAIAAEDRCVQIPDGVSDAAALAILLQGLTAWHLYRTAARVAAGESVVVVAAAGGVGSLATQLAKPMGAGRVIALASSADKRELALELGADVALDPDREDLADALIEANGGAPVDIVLEMAGGAVFDAGYKALAPFGRIVVHGIASKQQNELRSGSIMRGSKSVVGFWFGHCLEHPEMVGPPLEDLFARVARGELRVVEGPTYPLSEVQQAHRDIEARTTTGKLTLDPTR